MIARRFGNPRRRSLMGGALIALAVSTLPGTTAGRDEKTGTEGGAGQPAKLGLVESAGVSLTLLDVEVTDDHGRPIRGLRKDDFRVWLNGSEWTLYSVDDLCTCEEETAAGGRGAPAKAARGERAATNQPASASPGGARAPAAASATTVPSPAPTPTIPSPGATVPSPSAVAAVPSPSPTAVAASSASPPPERTSGPSGASAAGGERAEGEVAAEGNAARLGGGSATGPEVSLAGGSSAEAPGAATAAPAAAPGSSAPEADATGLRFVLFFDFGHLAADGRTRAFREASRWIKQTKAPGDLVAILGHSPKAGLREICPFTADAGKLLAALGPAEQDPLLQDTWPSFHEGRWATCAAAGSSPGSSYTPPPDAGSPEIQCKVILEEEYRRGDAAIKALGDAVESLGAIPGRKALVLFNQTGAIETGSIYPNVRFEGLLAPLRMLAGSHARLADRVAAEATLARTTINTAYMGDRLSVTPNRRWEVDLSNGALEEGAVFAESTGGKHNLDLSDLGALMSAVHTRCACIYRLGFEPRPDEPRGRVYQARVEVRGRPLAPRYRVTFLNDMDRWIRGARNVLRNPGRARDLSVAAALVPVRSFDGSWDLAVQLAVDTSSIEFVPSLGGQAGGGGSDASWEVGALLVREDDDKSWEMLGVSGAHRTLEGAPGRSAQTTVMHEHVFTGFRPGQYRLAAFVRDKAASHYGGAEAVIDLPSTGGDALTTPVLLLGSKRRVTASLPIFQKKGVGESRAGAPSEGSIPLMGETVRPGEALMALTWVCGGHERRRGSEGGGKPLLTRFISRQGTAIFRLGEPRIEPAGDCSRIEDRIQTVALEPGGYAYTIEYRTSAGAKPVSRSRSFVVEASSAPRP